MAILRLVNMNPNILLRHHHGPSSTKRKFKSASRIRTLGRIILVQALTSHPCMPSLRCVNGRRLKKDTTPFLWHTSQAVVRQLSTQGMKRFVLCSKRSKTCATLSFSLDLSTTSLATLTSQILVTLKKRLCLARKRPNLPSA